MANEVNSPNSNTTYSGKVAAGYVSKALLSCETLDGEHVTIEPNVKADGLKMQDVTVGTMLQEDSELFSATGTTEISERVLKTRALKVNRQESKTKLEEKYEGEKMKAGANNSSLPTDLNAFLIDLYTGVTAEEVEYLIWQGDRKATTTQRRFFDGFITLAVKDADVIDVPNPSAVTEANVIGKIKAAHLLVPMAIRRRKDYTIYVSDDVAELYTDALAAKSSEVHVEVERPLTYKGKKMVSLPGLPPDTIFATRKANLRFGTDLLADKNEVKVIDLSETTGDDLLRYKMRMRAGVNYVYGKQIVMHTTFVPVP